MPAEFDGSDFVDRDFQASRKPPNPSSAPFTIGSTINPGQPASREELDARVSETQQRLIDLKRAQEELERQRAALEEARRRQTEFHTGREEMVQHLTRGIGLLEEAEFAARRDAEQMVRTLGELREALGKVRAIRDETWTKDDYEVELTRALTTIENARMEWNSARLKWPMLSGSPASAGAAQSGGPGSSNALPGGQSLAELCRLGLALTWPLALVALAGLGTLIVFLLRK